MKFKQLAIDLAVIALLTSPAFVKATERGSPLTGSNASASAGAIASTGNSNAGGGNTNTDNNMLMLPSSTAAVANSGNVNIVCPVISVVSKASGWGWGAHSKSEIATEPARINYICVLYHNALQSGSKDDWKAFVDYAASQEAIAK
jgi:hypothetical protein